MKGDNIYSYTLRFNKEAIPDRQALEKIMQFHNMTHMSIQSTIMFMLAAVDISVLYDKILSLNVTLEKEPNLKKLV